MLKQFWACFFLCVFIKSTFCIYSFGVLFCSYFLLVPINSLQGTIFYIWTRNCIAKRYNYQFIVYNTVMHIYKISWIYYMQNQIFVFIWSIIVNFAFSFDLFQIWQIFFTKLNNKLSNKKWLNSWFWFGYLNIIKFLQNVQNVNKRKNNLSSTLNKIWSKDVKNTLSCIM